MALHRHTLRRRAVQLRQERAHEHDAIGVVDLAVFGEHVFAGAAVLGDEDFLRIPQRLHMLGGPIEDLGADRKVRGWRLGVALGERNLVPAGRLLGGQDANAPATSPGLWHQGDSQSGLTSGS